MITTRNLVLAAATLLTLGTTALSSTEASAYGFRRGGSYHHYHFGHFGYRHSGYRQWGHRYHWNYHRFGWRSPYRYSYRWNNWRPGVYGTSMSGPGNATGGGSQAPAPAMASAPAMAPAPSQTGCLAKQYTPEGAVVFIDRCTQESAVTQPPMGGPQPQQQ